MSQCPDDGSLHKINQKDALDLCERYCNTIIILLKILQKKEASVPGIKNRLILKELHRNGQRHLTELSNIVRQFSLCAMSPSTSVVIVLSIIATRSYLTETMHSIQPFFVNPIG